jgi:hypothetical protein
MSSFMARIYAAERAATTPRIGMHRPENGMMRSGAAAVRSGAWQRAANA